jgi:hypothetical protein
MPYQNKESRSKNHKLPSRKAIIIGGIVFLLMMLIAFYLQTLRERKLEQGITTKVLIVDKNEYLGAAGGIKVQFIYKGKQHISFVKCDSRNMQIGDSVIVKFAIDDPEIIKLID